MGGGVIGLLAPSLVRHGYAPSCLLKYPCPSPPSGMSHDDMGELELLEFFKQGSCFKKYNHARLAADRYHSCRLWIAAHELRCGLDPQALTAHSLAHSIPH